MNPRPWPPIYKFLLVGLVALLSVSGEVWGQTATATQARHETINQNIVTVTFDNNITFVPGPSPAGVTVRVNGILVTVLSAIQSGANTVDIQFDARSVTANTVDQ